MVLGNSWSLLGLCILLLLLLLIMDCDGNILSTRTIHKRMECVKQGHADIIQQRGLTTEENNENRKLDRRVLESCANILRLTRFPEVGAGKSFVLL